MSEYDVVVIGARLAGSALALLLARAGARVVALDRAHFPSDTLSSHQLQTPGVHLLARWGLLDRLVATGVPPTRRVRFDADGVVLEGAFTGPGPADAMYSPRRTILDALLVDAARESGAEIVEGFDAESLLGDGHTVTGVRGRFRERTGRRERSFTAPLVVGADGKNSWLRSAVGAGVVRSDARESAAVYTYWEGLDLPEGGEMYARPGRMIGVWPTHDGLTVTYVGMPAADLREFRSDEESAVLATFDAAGDLGKRSREARRVGPLRGTTDLPNRLCVSHGPGWALAGDAGMVMDPCTGQGMGHALQDAETLAGAILSALGGARPMAKALARYQRDRDEVRLPMYRFTADLASHTPRPGGDALFEAVAAQPRQTAAFFEVLSGTRSPGAFFGPRNLVRLLGWRGFLAMARRR